VSNLTRLRDKFSTAATTVMRLGLWGPIFGPRDRWPEARGCVRTTTSSNAFSKKIENHAAAVALWFMYYNFCRVHSTLRVTPAMESGLSNHVWSIEELVGVLEIRAKAA